MHLNTLHISQAGRILQKRQLQRSLRILRNHQIMPPVQGKNLIESRVFDDSGRQFDAEIDMFDGEVIPGCSCAEPGFCVHTTALFIRGVLDGLIPGIQGSQRDEFRSVLEGREASRQPSSSPEPDLFQEGLFAPDDLPDRDTEAAGEDPADAAGNPDEMDEVLPPPDFSDLRQGKDGACPLLRIEQNSGGTGIQLFFRYGDTEVSYRSSAHPRSETTHLEKDTRNRHMGETDGESDPIVRDLVFEEQFFARLKELINPDLVYERGIYADLFKDGPAHDFQIDSDVAEFLVHRGRALLDEDIPVMVENRPVYSKGELSLSIENDLDMLGIKVSALTPAGKQDLFQDPASDIPGLLRTGGAYVMLRERDLKQLEYLKRRGMDTRGILQTSSLNMVLLDRIYSQLDTGDQHQLQHILEMKSLLEDVSRIPLCDQPQGLKTRLRTYQHYGFSWLEYMLSNGMNPCLADDMGLGKTLQTLSLLLRRKEQTRLGTVLIITPVVTMANWAAEARRFAPALSLIRHEGSGRSQNISDLLKHDVVLVSYQTLRNDLSLLLDETWNFVILDEAHYIKNIQSQVFKAVRSLKSRHRVSLTGTPIENSVMELFAQMDFLNPGVLGSPRKFYGQFFRGIQREGDENLLDELKELVRPFILRRTKDEVLEELPGKEVIVRYVEMETEQRQVYEDARLRLMEEIQQESDARLKGSLMFQSLLRLRQLAIHPPLADPAYRGVNSAKMAALRLLMSDILSEDHKVLIFSQFIGSLEAIAALCHEEGWEHVLLTGKTRERDQEVRRFQNDPDTRVFLLSLKAGGVGINLTAADSVIIFDPWWNPAAEQQAIDRAHRMGQTKNVSAFKLIVKETIEEKILMLQEQKSSLADDIINGGGSLLSHLSREEMMELFR